MESYGKLSAPVVTNGEIIKKETYDSVGIMYPIQDAPVGFLQPSNMLYLPHLYHQQLVRSEPYKLDSPEKYIAVNPTSNNPLPLPISKPDKKSEENDPTSLCEVVYSADGSKPVRKQEKCRLHSCEMCGKEFNASSNLKTHMRIHSGERPYACKVCNQRFSTNSNLKTHIRTHTNEKPYKCDQCNQGFSTSSNLKVHYRTHSGERPYQCSHCGKEFTGKGNYKCHLLIHSGIKRFKCVFCEKRFTVSSNLKIHMRCHEGPKPNEEVKNFSCDVCEQTFATGSRFNMHKKSQCCVKTATPLDYAVTSATYDFRTHMATQ